MSTRLKALMAASMFWLALGGWAAEVKYLTLGDRQVHPSRVLARYRDPGTSHSLATQSTLSRLDIQLEKEIDLVPGLVFVNVGQALVKANASQADREKAQLNRLSVKMREMSDSGLFQYVEPDRMISNFATPNDRALLDGTLWGLRNSGNVGGIAGADIDAENAWDITTGSTNVVIAVFDTGIRNTHQELVNQMWINPGEVAGNGVDEDGDGYIDNLYGISPIDLSGDTMDRNDHGTHVSGTIGAAANDGFPHVGIMWNVRLMAIKVLGDNGFGSGSAVIQGLDFVTKEGVKLGNASIGGYGFSQAEFDAFAAARNRGFMMICAAGNESNNNDNPNVDLRSYPASFDLDNIISVAAIDRSDNLASFSNYGLENVDLGAPGVEIYSSTSGADDEYQTWPGTSMASPHVAGVAGLLLSQDPQSTYLEIRERILSSVVPINALNGITATGGRLNAFNALNVGADGILDISISPPSGTVIRKPSVEPLFVSVRDLFAVTNALVTAQVEGIGTVNFRNDGAGVDQTPADSIYSGNLAIPSNATEIRLLVRATAPGKQPAVLSVVYPLVSVQPNDNFSNAQKISQNGGVFTSNNTFATLETGEPNHAGALTSSGSLWWSYSLATGGKVFLDSTGSLFDTVVGVYTGNSVGGLTEVASVDNSEIDVPNSIQPRIQTQGFVEFLAAPGRTYFIAVAGVNVDEFGELRLRLTPNGQPDSVLPVVSFTQPISGSVVFSPDLTVEGSATDPGLNASGISSVFVRLNGSPIGTRALGTDVWSIGLTLEVGLNTIEAVSVDYSGNTSVAQRINVILRTEDAANDLFAKATLLNGVSGEVSGSNVNSSKEFKEPLHAGNDGGHSVWFRWKAPEDGLLFLSTEGSAFDTLMGLYVGSFVDQLVTLASSDDTPSGESFSEITQTVERGKTYSIAIDGFGGNTGELTLNYAFSSNRTFGLTVLDSENGTVSPGSGEYPFNTTILLTAEPEPFFEFSRWVSDSNQLISYQNPFPMRITRGVDIGAVFTPKLYSDDFETGKLDALGWTSGSGDKPWVVDHLQAIQGSFAARSGVITDGQTSRLVLVQDFQAGTGSFFFTVSSEESWDLFRFSIDGKTIGEWSGERPWAQFEFPVTRGNHKLEWSYTKDAGLSVGSDLVRIDAVDLPISLEVTEEFDLSVQTVLDGAGYFITIQGQPRRFYEFERSINLVDWEPIGLTSANSQGLVLFQDPDVGLIGHRFYRAKPANP